MFAKLLSFSFFKTLLLSSEHSINVVIKIYQQLAKLIRSYAMEREEKKLFFSSNDFLSHLLAIHF
ncbi:CLUMA_CG003088, isoform A [Clunio marinus]|uniref:CLUMA_CG003088, isoform A n=1 Tax=Clunio marinus TaxID=568069 RepID=A0A1J1HT09_9DIPT|nr:CLUMA_CG003088, isoform A [Clunio marinus]